MEKKRKEEKEEESEEEEEEDEEAEKTEEEEERKGRYGGGRERIEESGVQFTRCRENKAARPLPHSLRARGDSWKEVGVKESQADSLQLRRVAGDGGESGRGREHR